MWLHLIPRKLKCYFRSASVHNDQGNLRLVKFLLISLASLACGLVALAPTGQSHPCNGSEIYPLQNCGDCAVSDVTLMHYHTNNRYWLSPYCVSVGPSMDLGRVMDSSVDGAVPAVLETLGWLGALA